MGRRRHDAAQRQHGLDAFAGRHHVVRHAEPDAVSEKMAHRPPRRVDRRLVAAGRVEPGAVRAGDPAVEVGDRGDQCRPGLGGCVGIGAVVAARMEPQGAACVQSRNAASAQIRFGDCARNRLRHGEETACGFGRSARRRRGLVPGRPPKVGTRQAEEGSRLVESVAQAIEAAIARDQVEKITMFAGGGVGPFAGGALAAVRPAGAEQTGCAPACWQRRRPASSGPRDGRWRDSGGTPPRHCARDGGPDRRRAKTWRPPHAAARSAMRTSG